MSEYGMAENTVTAELHKTCYLSDFGPSLQISLVGLRDDGMFSGLKNVAAAATLWRVTEYRPMGRARRLSRMV